MSFFPLSLKNQILHTAGIALGLAALVLIAPQFARAADYFVRDAVADRGVSADDASAATNLVKTAVSTRSGDRLVEMESADGFVLQPRLMKLGDSMILTVEKIRGGETLFASQAKVARIEQLDGAARNATFAAIDAGGNSARGGGEIAKAAAAPYQASPRAGQPAMPLNDSPQDVAPSQAPVAQAPVADQGGLATTGTGSAMASGSTARAATSASSGAGQSIGRTPDVFPVGRKPDFWSLGVGPFIPHQMQNSAIMYDIAAGHVWDLNPLVGLKLMGEGNFSSAAQSGTFLNFSAGGNYYFPEIAADTVPYATGDIGYGFAKGGTEQTAEGFSVGLGGGIEFFRTTDTTLDLLLRYNVIFDRLANDGYPSVFGARLAVNF